MEEQVEAFVHNVQERFGLEHYALQRHHYFYEINGGQTSYLLSMEWFPNDHGEVDEDFNPDGTASIDVDIHTGQVKRIIFVQETSLAVGGDYPQEMDTESVIEWVETLTGLTFGKQFQLLSETDRKFNFQAVVDNIPVYPSGTINVAFNEDNKLCVFSVDGVFPKEEEVEWEPFSLTPEKADHIAKKQCELVEIPFEQDEKWLPVYTIEEVFLANDGVTTIPFEADAPDRLLIRANEVMEWDHPLDQPFNGEEIDFSPEISEETALANEDHPDTFPLTSAEQTACTKAVLDFLRRVYPNASGEWVLKKLYPQNGYIHATLSPVKQDPRIFHRKLQIVLNREACNVVNYVDNTALLDMFNHFQKAESAVLTQEEAYRKLQEYVTIMPRYVYNEAQASYILCGKIDCDYGIHAVTEELMPLDDL